MDCDVTFLGTATLVLDIGGLRLVTDPVFDSAGSEFKLGTRTRYRKLTNTAASWQSLGPVAAVLLSHDHHGDNLDRAGRQFLKTVPLVLTTPDGSRRLSGRTGGELVGLRPWQRWTLATPAGPEIQVTATPAQHAPWWLNPLAGQVTGFLLEWPGQTHGGLYISGDTILYRGIRQIARRCRIGTAVLHVGAGRFPATGRLHFSLTAEEAARSIELIQPRVCYPIHYEGWSHFSEGRGEVERAFTAKGLGERLAWLPRGLRQRVEV